MNAPFAIEELTPLAVSRLFDAGREAHYAAGAMLPGRDEGFHGIRLIGDGEVTVLAEHREGDASGWISVWHYGAGHALGLRDFLRPESRPRIAWRAKTDCLVFEIGAEALREALKADDGALRNALEEAAHLRDLEILMAVHPLFRLLDETERHALFEEATPRAIPAGECLIRAGQPNAELYLVTSGSLDIERDGVVIARREKGELIGEISALGFAPTADVRAREWTETLAFERDRILDLCERNTSFADHLAREGLRIPNPGGYAG